MRKGSMETGRHSGFSSCSGNWSWIKNRHRRLNDDYDYTRNETYTIYVPVEVDGRQVAKATAKYTKEEIEQQQKRDLRKKGMR